MKSLMNQRYGTMLLLCGILFLLTGCGGDDAPFESSPSGVRATDSTVARITIRSKSDLASTPIPVGREVTLDANAENASGLNISIGTEFGGGGQAVSMRWSSSNPSVASIRQGGTFGNSGILRAISPGRSEICVAASGVKDCVSITVR